jgi:hypothetical protein
MLLASPQKSTASAHDFNPANEPCQTAPKELHAVRTTAEEGGFSRP